VRRGPYRAADAFSRRDLEAFLAICDPEIEEVRDLGDVTIARQAFRGQGIESGAQMEQRQWQVTRWRHNKAFWWRSCPTEAEALEVAGSLERETP
jgi:hypothetical protein